MTIPYYFLVSGLNNSLKSLIKNGPAPVSEYRDFLLASLFYFSAEDELSGDTRLVSVYLVDSDGGRSETAFASISLVHVCDHPPIPERSLYLPQIEEDAGTGVLVQRINFTDADLGPPNRVTCQISGRSPDPLVLFSIRHYDDLTCDVIAEASSSSNPVFDYERRTQYSLTVEAIGVMCLRANTTIELSVS